MNKNYILSIILAATIGGAIAIGGYKTLEPSVPNYNSIQERQKQIIKTVSSDYSETVPLSLDFTAVSAKATVGVVFIQSTYEARTKRKGYFQYKQGPAIATGSGVIISDDGYIITNNHVVEDAAEIEITLEDNRSYPAKVIGTDPTTDLALIKIEEKNLDFIPYGDSDKVLVGQWVLAVGNPFNLASTVTAGIVSAKTRNIGILRQQSQISIESFIQTDAAVNPGNSGGALINTAGELVGINTAIASNTGSYAGYSFAVPVNLAKKVIDDLLEFGVVQRGLLGISIRDVSAQLSEEENLHTVVGVYIAAVNRGSGADEAGLQSKDVIIAIDGKEVRNTSRLQELVAIHRPGDKVEVKFLRDGREKTVSAVLQNTGGTIAVVERNNNVNVDGSVFEEVSITEQSRLNIDGGVKLAELNEGKWQETGIEEGFIITHIDKQEVNSISDFKEIMSQKSDERVIFLGVFPNGTKSYYSVDW